MCNVSKKIKQLGAQTQNQEGGVNKQAINKQNQGGLTEKIQHENIFLTV